MKMERPDPSPPEVFSSLVRHAILNTNQMIALEQQLRWIIRNLVEYRQVLVITMNVDGEIHAVEAKGHEVPLQERAVIYRELLRATGARIAFNEEAENFSIEG